MQARVNLFKGSSSNFALKKKKLHNTQTIFADQLKAWYTSSSIHMVREDRSNLMWLDQSVLDVLAATQDSQNWQG